MIEGIEGDIMPISGDTYGWNKGNIDKTKKEGATYALYHGDKLIYIGSAGDLRKRFQDYWNGNFKDDHCKRDTDGYKREYRNDYRKREIELLEEYKRLHGKLPDCNDVMPSD